MRKYLNAALLSLIAACAPVHAQTYEFTFAGSFEALQTFHDCEGCTDESTFDFISVPYTGKLVVNFGGLSAGPLVSRTSQLGNVVSYSYSFGNLGGLNQADAFGTGIPDSLVTAPPETPGATEFEDRRALSEVRNRTVWERPWSQNSLSRTWSAGRTQVWHSPSVEEAKGNTFTLQGRINGLGDLSALDAPFDKTSFLGLMTQLLDCQDCLRIYNRSFWFTSTDGRSSIAEGRATMLSMRELTSAVPEPSTWWMMLAGAMVIGGAIGRRRRGEANSQ